MRCSTHSRAAPQEKELQPASDIQGNAPSQIWLFEDRRHLIVWVHADQLHCLLLMTLGSFRRLEYACQHKAATAGIATIDTYFDGSRL